MGKSQKAKQKVTEYYLSLHYGWCHGPVDAVRQIKIGEKPVWDGAFSGTGNLTVSQYNLLGGVKKEGGYGGIVSVLQGESNQVLPDFLAAKMDAPAKVPGFRGIFTTFFHSGQAVATGSKGAIKILMKNGSAVNRGFYWGANAPFVRDTYLTLRRLPKGFYPEKAAIPREGSVELDANPAHIIWECATNTVWGAGAPASMIDYLSMVAAADKLHSEGFGLSLVWTGQQPVEAFIGTILEHIDATFDINPRTGLWTLDLIRDDYVIDDLPELTPDNFKLNSFTRRSIQETVNEINVTWRSPATEEDETVTYHDLGNIAQQGGNVISETLDFTGVRSASLAMRIAQREGARRGAPLAAIEGVANRVAWGWVPGEVVLLTWPKLDIYRLPVRLGSVDRGSLGSPGITIAAAEDVFSLPTNSYSNPPGSDWVDPTGPPGPITNFMFVDVPYFMVRSSPEAFEYPEGVVAVLAVSTSTDTSGFNLFNRQMDNSGALNFVDSGTLSLTALTSLPHALSKEITSLVDPLDSVIGVANVEQGTLFWLGGEGDDHEIVMLAAVDEEAEKMVLTRGCLDTVPRAWPAGTPLWVLDPSLSLLDPTPRAEGEVGYYKLQTINSRGLLPLEEAPIVTHTVTSRAPRPYRPANVLINGARWPSVVSGVTGDLEAVVVSWSNRNRLHEADVVLQWDAGNVTPEPGTVIVIELLNNSGTVVATFETAGTPVTSKTISLAALTGDSGSIRVSAKLNGVSSCTRDTHAFLIERPPEPEPDPDPDPDPAP